MDGQNLGITEEEKDIRAILTHMLKPPIQYARAVKTAQSVLGQINRNFRYRH
jgi:hypothetical protein